jgi:hypothetical protein
MLDQVYLRFVFSEQRNSQSADFRANKPSDIISTLVSIYDSKDLFVKELQVLLAQRLLAINDGKFEKEVCSSGTRTRKEISIYLDSVVILKY